MKNLFKEFIFELIGTAILMLFGISGSACSVLSRSTLNIHCAFTYAFGVVIASIVAGPVSGAHINPAITLSFAFIGKIKWRKVPVYILAQYIGSFVGCFLAWSIYFESIQGFDTGTENVFKPSNVTAGIFVTFPSPFISLIPAILDQVISTGLLTFAILFIADEYPNNRLLQTLITGFIILSFIIGFSFNCGAILNPARDLAPRLLLFLVGYKQMVFEPLNYKFWWAVGIIGPHLGAIIGAILFHYMGNMRQNYIEEHEQNILTIQSKNISIISPEAMTNTIDYDDNAKHDSSVVHVNNVNSNYI